MKPAMKIVPTLEPVEKKSDSNNKRGRKSKKITNPDKRPVGRPRTFEPDQKRREVNLYVTEADYEMLKDMSKRYDLTMSDICRRAIKRFYNSMP